MTLKAQLVELTSLGIADILAVKALFAISFFLVIRFLPRADIGVIGLVAGYLVLFRLLAIQPETILSRSFPTIKGNLNEHLSAFFTFWIFRTFILMVIGGLFFLLLSLFYGNSILPLYLLGSVLIFNLELFQEIAKETHRVSFRQKTILVVNVAFMAFQLLAVLLLALYPSLLLYLLILVFINLSSSATWLLILRHRYGFHFKYQKKETSSLLKKNLRDFSLWFHFNEAIMQVVSQIDTLILGFFVSLEVIGDYTIALFIAGFFFLIPRIMYKSFTIGFANMAEQQKIKRSLGIFSRYSLLVSVLQLAFFAVFGMFITSIFTQTSISAVFTYTLLILSGLSLLILVRPILALIIAKDSLRRAFWQLYLPGGVVAIVAYILLTAWYGAIGTAYGNIVSYAAFAVLALAYYLAHMRKGSEGYSGAQITEQKALTSSQPTACRSSQRTGTAA